MGLVQRRDFLIATAAVLALPLGAEAQQAGKVARIGVLGTTPPAAAVSFHAFQKGLQELGYVEGQRVHIDYLWPEGERAGYAALAAELVKGKFDVILTISAGAALAVKSATDAVPIVFCAVGDDPVQLGMIASLARPGGNTTGTVILSRELEAKRLDLLKEAVPGLSRVAMLWNPSIPPHRRMLRDVEEAAPRLNIRVIPVEWRGPEDVEKAFELARSERVGGVLALSSSETWRAREQIARVALKHRLPTVGSEPGFAAAGNLVQYGPNLPESCRRAAFYVDRILKGAKPGELPVEQPTRFELVVNLKTAQALGLTMPQTLLQRADEVIQ